MVTVSKAQEQTSNAIVIELFKIDIGHIGCNDNTYYPGIVKCTIDATLSKPTATLGCRDGYIDSTGNCVSSCGIGSYGLATYS